MNLYKITAIALMTISIIGLLSLIPLPGTSSTQTFNISSEQVDIILIDQPSIKVEEEEWNALGQYHITKKEIKLATEKLSVFQFMDTCSHEIKHVGTGQTTEKDHEQMNTVMGYIMPWNWETQCFRLLDNRLYL